jgi:hypothetical protein
MEPRDELTIETQDEREWELSDEELDRTDDARACCGGRSGHCFL